MAGNEPPYLVVGTEVSAKYRGAFCEAKVKKVARSVKCKVTLKDTNNSVNVSDDCIRGTMKMGGLVEVKYPDTDQYMEGILNRVTDSSMYTVVFNDGDERTLRRTMLCLKGEKHFIESETLDQLPLTHPEHFGTPVMQGRKQKRNSSGEGEDSSDESSDESTPKKKTYSGRLQDMLGRVVSIEYVDKKKVTTWYPALVVLPSAADISLKTKSHLLVKSFKDNKFYPALKKDVKDFTRDIAIKNEEKSLKTPIEKALLFIDNKELPPNWDKDELIGSDNEDDESEAESSDDEPSEEKDLFVAQLYKFMDDRGTPINKAPTIGMRDLNLYRLFRVVQKYGGYNRVTNQMKWRLVYSKMGLPQSPTASQSIKSGYKKYLHAFEDFQRKLGSTMGTMSRPGRNRHGSGRNLVPYRERESPKSPRGNPKEMSPQIEREKEDVRRKLLADKEEEKKKSEEEKKKMEDTKKKADEEDKIEESKDIESKSEDAKVSKFSKTMTRQMSKDVVKNNDDLKPAASPSPRRSRTRAEGIKKLDTDSESTKSSETKLEKTEIKSEKSVSKADSKCEDKKSESKEKDKRPVRSKSLVDEKSSGIKSTEEKKNVKNVDEKSMKSVKSEDKKGAKTKVAEDKKVQKPSKVNSSKDEKDEKSDQEKDDKKLMKTPRRGRSDERSMSVKKEPVDEKIKIKKSGRLAEKEAERAAEQQPENKKPKLEESDTRKKLEKKAEEKVIKKESKEVKKDTKKEDKVDKPGLAKGENKSGKQEKAKPPDKSDKDDQDKSKKITVRKKKDDLDSDKEDKNKKDSTSDDILEDTTDLTKRPLKLSDYPMGCQLLVRYGKGKTQKLYKAKIVEAEMEGNVTHSLKVHYAGWNTRYDEWIKRDRIVRIIDDEFAKKIENKGAPPKAELMKANLKTDPLKMHKDVAVSKPKSADPAPIRPPKSTELPQKSPKFLDKSRIRGPRSPFVRSTIDRKLGSRTPGSTFKKTSIRPTRSKSTEIPLSTGIPIKRPSRSRRTSGVTDISDAASRETPSEDDPETDSVDENKEKEDAKDVKAEKFAETKPAEATRSKQTDSVKRSEMGPPILVAEVADLFSEMDSVSMKSDTEIRLESTDEDGDENEHDKSTDTVEYSGSPPDLTALDDAVDEAPSEDASKDNKDVCDKKDNVAKTEKEIKTDKSVDKGAKKEVDSDKVIKSDTSEKGSCDKLVKENTDNGDAKLEDVKVKVEGDNVESKDKDDEEKRADTGKKKRGRKISISNTDVKKEDKHDVSATENEDSKAKKGKKKKEAEPPEVEEDFSQKRRRKKKRKLYEDQADELEIEALDHELSKSKDEMFRVLDELNKGKEEAKAKDDNSKSKDTEIAKKKRRKSKATDFDQKPSSPVCLEQTEIKSVSSSDLPASELKPKPSTSAGAPSASCERSKSPSEISLECHETLEPETPVQSTVVENTPPTTPEGSIGYGEGSPTHDDEVSTKSDQEANAEVASYMVPKERSGESPNYCDASTVSEGSGGSSGNAPGSEDSGEINFTLKRQAEEDKGSSKKKRKSSRKGKAKCSTHHKNHGSDSDDQGGEHSPLNSSQESTSRKLDEKPRSPRPSKYNFKLDPAEIEDLDREKRIALLMSRITEVRKVYMQLKAEVAMIDRRKKRARRREREAHQSVLLSNGSDAES